MILLDLYAEVFPIWLRTASFYGGPCYVAPSQRDTEEVCSSHPADATTLLSWHHHQLAGMPKLLQEQQTHQIKATNENNLV